MPPDPRTPGLLSLLPEGAEERLRKIAVQGYAASDARFVADEAAHVVGSEGYVVPEARLLVLLIQQAREGNAQQKRIASLEAGLHEGERYEGVAYDVVLTDDGRPAGWRFAFTSCPPVQDERSATLIFRAAARLLEEPR